MIDLWTIRRLGSTPPVSSRGRVGAASAGRDPPLAVSHDDEPPLQGLITFPTIRLVISSRLSPVGNVKLARARRPRTRGCCDTSTRMVRTYGSETSSGGDSYGARQYDGYGDARDHHHRGQPHHADHGGHQGGYDDETHPRYPPQSYGYGHHPAQPGRRERVDADGGITGVCLGGYGGGTTLSPAPAKSFGVHRMRKNEVTGKVGGSFGDVAAMQRVMGHDAHHPNAMPPPRRFNDRAIDAHASSSVYVPGGGFGDGDDRWGDGVTGKVGSGVAMNQRNRVQPPRGFNDRAINAHASSSVYVPGGGFGGQGDEPEHPTRRRQQHQIDETQ